MKFIFKTLLIYYLSQNTVCASKVIITYEENYEKISIQMKNHFLKKYMIPGSLIHIKKVNKCKSLDQRFLELCINKKGELIEFSNIDKDKILKSLKTFTLGRAK